MRVFRLTPLEARCLAAFAIIGLLVPNTVFVYFALTSKEAMREALHNPISLVFIIEALFLMLLFAWLLRKIGAKRPSGTGFIVMSLLGSMGFSVPLTLYMIDRDQEA